MLDLVETADVVAGITRPGLLKVGFAAETEHLRENARAKLERKGLDLIIANDAETTIGAPDAALTFIRADGGVEELGRRPKEQAAERVIAALTGLMNRKGT